MDNRSGGLSGDHTSSYSRASDDRRILSWIPAAFAVLVIVAESTAMMSAENTGRWLLPIWIHLFGPITAARWAIVHHLIRKSGHFVGYGLVSVSFFYGWKNSLSAPQGLSPLWRRAALYSIGCTFLVASADEFHQSFLPSRTGTPYDVMLDTCGAVMAQLVVLLVMALITRKSAVVPVPA
jgi:VanZ family protein